MDELLRLALNEHVHEGLQRIRVREGQRPTSHDKRMPLAALLLQQRQPRELQHREDAGQLQLIRHREGQHGEAGDGGLGLIGEELRPRTAVRLHVLREEGSLGGGAWVEVDLPVDRLVAKRAHPHVVGARVAEGYPVGRLLAERALLVRELRAHTFDK
jgi:hypothetical protein